MADISLILSLTQVSIFTATVVLALVYVLVVLTNRRFHHIHNVFKLNVCFALTTCNLFFITFFLMAQYNIANLYVEKYCLFLFYAYMVAPLQVPLAFVSVSFHRLFLVVYYTQAFFDRKIWVILCLSIQWILGFLIPIPFLIRETPHCFLQPWMNIYALVLIVLVPSCISLVLNMLIFLHVRSSSKRVQPQAFSIDGTTNITPLGQPPRPKMGRRDLRLLKQMIYMFSIFVGGWGPVYIFLNCTQLLAMVPIIAPICIVVAACSSFVVIVQLIFGDHEIRKMIREQYQRCLVM